MTKHKHKLRRKADRYCRLFEAAGAGVRQCSPALKGPDALEIAAHAAWMCAEVPGLLDEGKESRAIEGIRFVEGILWSMGAVSINDMDDGAGDEG